MKTLAIVQARMESTRLPGKVMKKLSGKPVIEFLVSRLRKSNLIDSIVVAIPDNERNLILKNHLLKIGCDVFTGSENNVLNRYYEAAKFYNAKNIIRITGDCPLIDPELIDQIINLYYSEEVDYVSNILPPTYPDGLDVEIFSFKSLSLAENECSNNEEREHVTSYLINQKKFTKKNFEYKKNLSNLRWTLDEPEDYQLLKTICNRFDDNFFNWHQVTKLFDLDEGLKRINSMHVRNEGSKVSTGQKLWARAKKVIPGGNMLFSKRPEMYLPNIWPAYFSKTEGCSVWDLDGNKYYDMSIMGVGTNILGYNNKIIDDAVKQVIDKGNMSTFNCPEEVYLSEKLIELHPWAEMVRLARTGGEANAVAVRIARACTNNKKIAVCGYHGWHDWYLAANLSENNSLSDHLIAGLDPRGVPNDLKNTIFPFSYNDFGEKNEKRFRIYSFK